MKPYFLLWIPVFAVSFALTPRTAFKVSGKITDEQGSPIAGVTVKVVGGPGATLSGADGTYFIELMHDNDVLLFSMPGYSSKKEKVKSRPIINVVLKASAQKLEEVVVRAYDGEADYLARAKPLSSNKISSTELKSRASDFGVDHFTMPEQQGRTGFSDRSISDFNTEDYDGIVENRFLTSAGNPLSTFSIDIDAASYSNVRRYLNMGQLPPAGAVRIEEMINYFHYQYPAPEGNEPFSVNTEMSECPWNKDNKLVLVGLQGKTIPINNLAASNLVFLIDVSGSMQDPQKLPLVQASMKMLVDRLREQDHVSIVVYAGAAGLVLPPTNGNDKAKIKAAIDRLEAGGSTAGGAGIQLAYKTARTYFIKGGNNRVILCTDGDFNVGASSDDEMERLIENERKSGVFLTVLGYGMGNYKDNKMQKLADKGNGNHAYIDGIDEARKVLVSEFGGTLFTIAKDVKLQIEFNPAKVQAYRLIGYENRLLSKEDFNNDQKDAGELGSGHSVTALYEIIPVGVKSPFIQSVDPLKYQQDLAQYRTVTNNEEMMNIKLRYKLPDADNSRLLEHAVIDLPLSDKKVLNNLGFAASVAEFGLLLRHSEFKARSSFKNVLQLAANSKGNDDEGYRSEFVRLVKIAESIYKNDQATDDEDVSVRDN